jgi:predicted GNAT family acetyltransferase
MEQKIHLNKEKKRFELKADGHMATLYYDPYEPSVWSLTHTLVPDPLKGKGIGSGLVKQVFAYCQENQIRIIPECSFVVSYIQKHPEWKKLLFEQE